MSKRDEEISITDIEIDYINQKRNIPFQLTAEEEMLYGYSQDITLKQLEVIRDQYEGQVKDEQELAFL